MIDDSLYDELGPIERTDPKQLRLTRRLALIWAGVGLVLFAILCYFLASMIASLGKGKDAARIGLVADFEPNSIQTIFINTPGEFVDPGTNKAFTTLALDVVRDERGDLRVFFARSTNSFFGVRTPRECVVKWDEQQQRFAEPCGGAKWTRDGKYASGPASRDLDLFPVQIRQEELWIELRLIPGAVHD